MVKVRSGEVPAHILAILAHYERLGFVKVKPWDTALPFCRRVNQERFCQLAQINDCLLRAAFLFKYVAVVDYDELFLPTANGSAHLLPFIRSLDRCPCLPLSQSHRFNRGLQQWREEEFVWILHLRRSLSHHPVR